MNPFELLEQKILGIEKEIQNKSIDIAFTEKDEIKEMQINQIDNSLNASGKLIKPPYSKRYRVYKQNKGRTGNVDLREKGDFLNEVAVLQHNNEIHIVSFDEKSKYLVPKYDPFGLMEKNLDNLRSLVFPILGTWVRKTIGL